MKILYFPKKVYYLDLINYQMDITKYQFMYKTILNDVYIIGLSSNNDEITWDELRRECSSVKRYYVLRKEDLIREEQLFKNINDINFQDIGI